MERKIEKIELRLKVNKLLWDELVKINAEYLLRNPYIKSEIAVAALETFVRWYKEKKRKGEL